MARGMKVAPQDEQRGALQVDFGRGSRPANGGADRPQKMDAACVIA